MLASKEPFKISRLPKLVGLMLASARRLKFNFSFMRQPMAWTKALVLKFRLGPWAILTKRWRISQKLSRQGGDFKQLKELFRQKRAPLLLSEPITKKNETTLGAVNQAIDGNNTVPLTGLDFNKFLTNGAKKNKDYHLQRFSFDKILKDKLVKAKKLAKDQESFSTNMSLESDMGLEQKKSLDKVDDKLQAFVNREQNLIKNIAQSPHDDKLYTKLGELYLAVKNWQDAQASFEYAAKLNPNSKSIQKSLAKIKKLLHN